jgi:fluoride exporter
MQSFLLVGAGGALGAMARYGATLLVGRWWSAGFPLATLLINIVGSTLMGILVGLLSRYTPAWSAEARLFAAVGVLGGFTTFSAFSLDAVTLMERGELLPAALYILFSVALCLAGLYLGLLLTRGVA